MRNDNVVIVRNKRRVPRRYAVKAVVFQEGEWLCARCLEYDFVVQAKTLQQLSRNLQLFVAGHIALRVQHAQQPFQDLRRAPDKYWAMFKRSRLKLPAPMFKLGVLKSNGVVIEPPQIRIAAPSAAA